MLNITLGLPAPLYNLYLDSFLLISTSFVVRTRGIVCGVYLLFRLVNYKNPCKRCVLAHYFTDYLASERGRRILNKAKIC